MFIVLHRLCLWLPLLYEKRYMVKEQLGGLEINWLMDVLLFSV